VTDLPVLIDAVPENRRDGRVIVPDDYDIAVRVLPLDAPEMLSSMAATERLDNEFKTVPQRQRAGLLALLRLVQAIQTRSHKHLAAYSNIQSEIEIQRWLAKQKEFVAAFGPRRWRMPTNAQVETAKSEVAAQIRGRARFPISEVSRHLNRYLRRARFVIWWSEREQQLLPGLYCKDMATAMAALMFSRVASTKGRAVCGRCGKEFVRTRRTQTFCTLRCGNAARKARQRADQREA
jgi:hypothetical protein